MVIFQEKLPRSVVLIDAVSLMEFILLPLQAKLIKETRVVLAPLQTKIDSFSRNIANSTDTCFFLSFFLFGDSFTKQSPSSPSISIHIHIHPPDVFQEESKNRAHHSAAVKSVRTKKVIRTTTTVVHTGWVGGTGGKGSMLIGDQFKLKGMFGLRLCLDFLGFPMDPSMVFSQFLGRDETMFLNLHMFDQTVEV